MKEQAPASADGAPAVVDRRTFVGLGAALGGAVVGGARAQPPASFPGQTWLSPLGDFEGTPCYTMSNGTLDLTFLQRGGSLASVVLHDDPNKLSPYWNSVKLNRERGRPAAPNSTTGHLICVDGFGAPSPEEAKAGLLQHGEAHLQSMDVRPRKEGPVAEVTLSATLPIVHEMFTRTMRMVDGENVVYFESRLDSLLGFDRIFTWVEHATVGPPFAEPGVTVFDLSAGRAQTNAYEDAARTPGAPPPHRRLASEREFTWPLAPGAGGGVVDLRQLPTELVPESEFATVLLDPSRPLVWATSFNPRLKLMIGYVMRRADYPWMLNWGSYGTPGKPVRGMEFGVTLSGRRRSVAAGSLLGAPTYRWLPANGSITTRFAMFYTRVPDGFTKVDDVRMENGQIVIEDHAARKQIALKASMSL